LVLIEPRSKTSPLLLPVRAVERSARNVVELHSFKGAIIAQRSQLASFGA